MVDRYCNEKPWEVPTDAFLFQHETCLAVPAERPGKGDGLEVWLRLAVATGPECTQNKIVQVAVKASLIYKPFVLLAAQTLFQQHFFPVAGERDCLSVYSG